MGFEHSLIDPQLVRQKRNAVLASYNHAQYLRQQVRLTQSWSNSLDVSIAGNVVPVRKLSA